MTKSNPSCNDGKRNQGEEAIDCGGPCRPCPQLIKLSPLEIGSVEWVHDTDNKYDFIAQIKNPNDIYGVGSFDFKIVATIVDEEVIQNQWEDNYILPGEEKSLFIHGMELANNPASAKLEINEESIDWQKFTSFEEPNFVISDSNYDELGSGSIDFGVATGTLINRSIIDFETIDIHVALRDERGKLLVINSQRMNTVRAGEFRDYRMIFPYAFSGSVEKVEPFVETNPFDSYNYIKTYGKSDKWNETREN